MIKSWKSMCARQTMASQRSFTCSLYHALMKCFLIGSQSVIKQRLGHLRSMTEDKDERTAAVCVRRVNKRQWWRCRKRASSKLMLNQMLGEGKQEKFLSFFSSFCIIYASLWTSCARTKKKKILSDMLAQWLYLPSCHPHPQPLLPFHRLQSQ